MEDANDGLGCAEEESRAPQAKASEAGGGALELDCLEIAVADATTDVSVVAEAGLAQTEGAAAAEVVASRPATDEVVAGDIAATEASSGPARLGDLREAVGEATPVIPVSVRSSEPPAVIAQATSTLKLASSATTDAPVPETETGTTTSSLFFGATFDPERASRRPHDIRMVESKRNKASSCPRAVTQGAPRGKISWPQPGLALAAKVLPASSKRNGRILPPVPGPVEALRPRVIT
jgi:hypothetical protein